MICPTAWAKGERLNRHFSLFPVVEGGKLIARIVKNADLNSLDKASVQNSFCIDFDTRCDRPADN